MASPAHTPRFHHTYLPTEYVEYYAPGGYHPVHFGETFNGIYCVTRKLGYGSFSTVWLARNMRNKRYVTMKILTAKHSAQTSELDILLHLAKAIDTHPGRAHVTPLLDSFVHRGPNGNHLCLIFNVMGPSVEVMEELFKLPNQPWKHIYPKAISKEISRQTLLGLDYLHSNGIIHGDLQPGNILFTIPDLSSVDNPELGQEQDQARLIADVKRLDGKELDESAPRYLVVPQPLTDMANTGPGFRIKISDMALWDHGTPERSVTPVALRAPEQILCNTWEPSLDVWSLGCVIFQLVTGQSLFSLWTFQMSDEDVNDEHLLQLIEIIGPLPGALFEKWTRSTNYFDANGNLIGERQNYFPLEDLLKDNRPKGMGDDECDTITSLLRSMLSYDPSQRVRPAKLLEHPWFTSSAADCLRDSE